MTRGHAAPLSAPGSFRCLVCQVYVKGTESGHCPRCGFVPPSAPPVPEPRRIPTTIVLGAAITVALAIAAAMYA
jgi:hypothetical protein